MDMYQVKWTRLQSEIFRFFCIKAGHSLSLRGIARHLNKSPTAVSNALKELEKEGLIKVKKISNINLLSIEFNRDNQDAIDMKRAENLKMVYESGLVKFLQNSFPGTVIILFGSYSRGDDVWTNTSEKHLSDIDIAIIGTKSKEIKLLEFNKKLERKVTINFYISFKEIHKNLRDSILNGILLSGSIDI
ncbi:MAG: nucleotidyltransferase domain-containing protein [Nanoarchaeota archaeon]